MSRRGAQQGQSAVEFLVVFLGFAGLLLGLFEMTRVYRAKHVLKTATFAAARAGSLHNANLARMNAELANGMAPLLMSGTRSVEGLANARRLAQRRIGMPGSGVQIISPGPDTITRLQQYQWSRISGDTQHRWRPALPNDNLALRPRSKAMVRTPSADRHLTIQDANLLKVRSLWCHRLVVPGLDRVIHGIAVSLAPPSSGQAACDAAASPAGSGSAGGYFLPLSAQAIVRLQSAFHLQTVRDGGSGQSVRPAGGQGAR